RWPLSPTLSRAASKDVRLSQDSSGKVKYAVCASDCNNRTTCPPYTYAAADKFCSYGRCHIMCPLFSNPCPAGSECVQIEGLHVNMCVYENSAESSAESSGTFKPTDEPAHYVWQVPEYPRVDRLDGVKRCYVTEVRVNNFKSYNGEHVTPLTIPAIPLLTQSSSTGEDRSAEVERVPVALTGVLGPNGSGKSNLLDAVCFCLCVGAKRLRNDRLRSLVNSNHTMESKREFTASTSLTVRIERELPPGEGDASRNDIRISHTTFTRSVTIKAADNDTDRGAEDETNRNDDRGARGPAVGSVYRVNDRVCTQVQYKEELSKHHLGADASFFLVLQGQIDKLLSKDDAMSITKAIESASGSWRYRKDYDIVAKKKEHAEDNVTRLTAKGKQINQDFNALAAQVQEADRYKDKRAELERKQLDKVTYSLYEIEKEADALLESSEGLLESYEDAKAAVQEAKTKENAAGEETKYLAGEHKRLQKSLEKVRKKQEDTEIRAAELRGRKKQLTANEAKVGAGIAISRETLGGLEERMQGIDGKAAEIEASMEALAVRRDTIGDEVDGGVLTEEIVEECGRISERAQEVAASIESSIRASKEQRILLDQYIDETKATITRLEETQGIRQRESHAAETDMNALRKKMNARELAVAEERRKRVENREAKRVPSNLQGSHASHRSIIELIQKLHRWLLGKTVVSDSLAQARSVLYHSGRRNALAMPSGVKVVTLDGDKIAKNGNMSNGQGALPGDAQHVDSIKAELAQKDGEIARIEEELRELIGIDGMNDEAVGDDPMDARLEMARVEMGSLEQIKRVAEEEVNRIEASIEASRGSLAELEAQRDEAVNHLRQLEEELSDKTKSFYEDINRRVFGEDDGSGDGGHTRDVMSLIRERKEALDNIEAEVCKLRQQRDTLRGKREALEADLDRARATLTSQESNLEELRRALEEILDEEKAMEAELAATREAGEGAAEELEAKVAEAVHEAGQQSKAIFDRCNELKAAVTKEEHRLQQLRYRHMQLVRSILSKPRNQRQQQSISVTQEAEEDEAYRLPFENAAEVLPSLKRILFGRIDIDEDDGTQDTLDEYDALELRVDEGVVGRILSESASRREARAGAREVVAVLEDEIERLQEIVTHMKPNLRAYERGETPEDPLLTPDAAHRGRPTAFTGQRRGGALNQDAGGSVYLDAENVDEPYLGVVQFSAHPESDRFVDSQLLSGGEKTIAAAALLFAIFAWQRPALVLLDEVDAALDKRNLSTLSHFVRERTSDCTSPDDLLQAG
ncbi:Structural maintenance of chromosomes protein 1B, partial [Perkinsus olseni]